LAIVRELFLQYANSLGFSLCFQNFDKELAGLPGGYTPPRGRLLLATSQGKPAGCVALHPLERETCEMKRLYVCPEFRGKGIGLALVNAILEEARKIGYRCIRLDTVEPSMRDAVAMYRRFGFREIPPYRSNPMPGTLYMELDL
jgi:ribosomal protein S18 acetylase RimI-like enzyme